MKLCKLIEILANWTENPEQLSHGLFAKHIEKCAVCSNFIKTRIVTDNLLASAFQNKKASYQSFTLDKAQQAIAQDPGYPDSAANSTHIFYWPLPKLASGTIIAALIFISCFLILDRSFLRQSNDGEKLLTTLTELSLSLNAIIQTCNNVLDNPLQKEIELGLLDTQTAVAAVKKAILDTQLPMNLLANLPEKQQTHQQDK